MHRRNVSEDMAVSHFSEQIMLFLNLLVVAFVKELNAKTYPEPNLFAFNNCGVVFLYSDYDSICSL